jgi:hypothetical protein
MCPKGKIPLQIGGYSVGERQGFAGDMSSPTLQSGTFCGYSDDTLLQ